MSSSPVSVVTVRIYRPPRKSADARARSEVLWIYVAPHPLHRDHLLGVRANTMVRAGHPVGDQPMA
jgi:hypothetical protein